VALLTPVQTQNHTDFGQFHTNSAITVTHLSRQSEAKADQPSSNRNCLILASFLPHKIDF
jgi:hypothetical protein